MSRQFVFVCLLALTVQFEPFALADMCGLLSRHQTIAKFWSKQSQDSRENQEMGSEAADTLNPFLLKFHEMPSDFPCRASVFRDIVQETAALAPFEWEGKNSHALEQVLHDDPDLIPVFDLALQDYQDHYAQDPKISCRANMVMTRVADQRCHREQNDNCEDREASLAYCKGKYRP